VDAQVSDGTRTFDGLKKEDFRIFDNGVEQAVTSFSQDQEPLDLILVFDTSSSMKPLSSTLPQPRDRLSAASFRRSRAVWTFTTHSRILGDVHRRSQGCRTHAASDLMNWQFGGAPTSRAQWMTPQRSLIMNHARHAGAPS